MHPYEKLSHLVTLVLELIGQYWRVCMFTDAWSKLLSHAVLLCKLTLYAYFTHSAGRYTASKLHIPYTKSNRSYFGKSSYWEHVLCKILHDQF